jgi:hypothetical protein
LDVRCGDVAPLRSVDFRPPSIEERPKPAERKEPERRGLSVSLLAAEASRDLELLLGLSAVKAFLSDDMLGDCG